ncbi:Ig-like domain-containing protein [Paraglaciecola sp.]|uniref:Ig-like domain-containing protein n=1 Tax=Paraglaciecola sp. TaxID=1920173 RepID=UPI0032673E2D
MKSCMKDGGLFSGKNRVKTLAVLIGCSLLPSNVLAGNSWLSKSTVLENQKQPKSYYSTNLIDAKAIENSDQVLFDITVSLYNSPAGDDDALTTNGDPQEIHEEIIGHFADAVCEQSNGIHKLQKVSLFKNKKHQAKADIIWNNSEWPRAHLAGFGANGMHIYFGDIFPGGNGTSDKDMLADTKGAGYTLGHEWGHYVYGLFDEYSGSADSTASASTPQNTDVETVPSIMSNQWLASTSGNQWLNHSTSNNLGDAARTAQGRVYGKSGWEILVQDPKDDPKSGQATAQPDRTRYLALGNGSPTAADNWVKEELADANFDCRSQLDIVWVDGDIDMQIVIDRSGSMGGTPIANATQAAKLLVDATAEGTTSLGVVSFANSPSQTSALQVIPSPGTTIKEGIKQTIDTIYSGGSTALFDGAQLALDNLVTYQSQANSGAPGVVFVLADGDDNSSYYSQANVIQNYQSANIPIFSFGYGGASPTGPLLELANGTGGKYFSSPTTLSEITDAFLQANALATDSQNLADTSSSILASSSADFDLEVDSGIANLSLFFSHNGNVDDISFGIYDAADDLLTVEVDCISLSGGVSCSANIDETQITTSDPGAWRVNVENTAVYELDVSFNASGEPSDNGTFNVTVEGVDGNSISYPELMILTTAITKDRNVTGVNVSALIVDPNSVETQFHMTDDGTNGDGTANDGIYSAIIGYQTNGLYQVSVFVDNSNLNAKFSDVGLLTPTVDGSQPTAPVLPAIQENFYRVSKASLVVSNVPFSDGDDSISYANQFTPDNTGFDSQINSAGDIDFFEADGVDTTQSIFVRVTRLSLGMMPKLTVLASDGVTPIVSGATLADSISDTGYLYKEIDASLLTSTIYLTIEHEDSAAVQGGYEISLGAQLNTDVPPNSPPQVAADSETLFAGFSVTLAPLANDIDSDGDIISIDSLDSAGALGELTLNTDGTVTFNAETAYAGLVPGESLTEVMSYIVSDGNGGFSKGEISVLVIANSHPDAVADNFDVAEDAIVSFTPLLNDSDVDGHTITFVSIESSQLAGVLTDNGDGSYLYDPNGQFNHLSEGESSQELLTYVIADELLAETTGTVTISVNGLNQAPIAIADSVSVAENTTVDFDVIANDTDADLDVLTVTSIDSTATSGEVTLNANGTVHYDPNGLFDSLDFGSTGTDTFTYIVSDGELTEVATVTVTITGVDDPAKSGGGGGSIFWLLPLCFMVAVRKLKNS